MFARLTILSVLLFSFPAVGIRETIIEHNDRAMARERSEYTETVASEINNWQDRLADLRERQEVARSADKMRLREADLYLESKLADIRRHYAELTNSRNGDWEITRDKIDAQLTKMNDRYSRTLAE